MFRLSGNLSNTIAETLLTWHFFKKRRESFPFKCIALHAKKGKRWREDFSAYYYYYSPKAVNCTSFCTFFNKKETDYLPT